MTNERIIFNEVCTHYDALQRHDLVSRFYTAEQVERYTAGLKFEPDGNGNTPRPCRGRRGFLVLQTVSHLGRVAQGRVDR